MRLFFLCAYLAGTTAFVARPSIVQRRSSSVVKPLASTPTSTATLNSAGSNADYELLGRPARPGRPLKVAIAGGGVGGLTSALCLLKKGFDVTVYEKTAAFARFGGPIQFASNALSVLKEIDEELFRRVMEKFTFTGTRRCGIKDGLRADGNFRMTDDSLDYLWNKDAPADWFVKFPLKVCTCTTVLPYS
jgi:zeaxanthin epoxidase